MARIVRLAERELKTMAGGESTDLDLLEDIMRYVTAYPDAHHHPAEDVVFEYLKQRAPRQADEIDAIVAEHEDIIGKGHRFLDAIEAAQEDAMVPRDELVRLGRAYLSSLQAHMNVEEGRLFPAAEQHLTASDWRAIEERIAAQHDPLFGPGFDASYGNLRRRIEAHGA